MVDKLAAVPMAVPGGDARDAVQVTRKVEPVKKDYLAVSVPQDVLGDVRAYEAGKAPTAAAQAPRPRARASAML